MQGKRFQIRGWMEG